MSVSDKIQAIRNYGHIIKSLILFEDFRWLLSQAERIPKLEESRDNMRFLIEEQSKEINSLREQLAKYQATNVE